MYYLLFTLWAKRTEMENELLLMHTYFLSPYRQWHSCVEVLSSIINWLSISKDLCFKVLDHVSHNFTEGRTSKIREY